MIASVERIGIGFIGAGRISDLHAIEYCANPGAEIVAICDVDIELASGRAAAWGVGQAKVYADYRDLLADPAVDAVEILVPHHLHHLIASAALAAGKHVSLQKPMTLDLREADDLVARAAASGKVFKVFENFIFYPPVMQARALIDDGAIGTPLSIRIKSNPGRSRSAWAVPPSAQVWRADASKSGGGPLCFDDGHHKFALAWHFMGRAEAVHAWIGQSRAPDGFLFDAPALISWRFSEGRVGCLEVVYSPELDIITEHYAQDDRVEITGTRGVISINRGHGRLGDQPPVVLQAGGKTVGYSDMDTGWEASFVESTRQFIKVLRDGGTPRLTGAEGREVLAFTIAAQDAARLGGDIRPAY
ncbi:MAG: Gfo/Idh/MocA family oxidoreductase [Ancalomicrobiaceae bacterium]|nr:Gfo/Idh/MocA family oxidoreductase [Ancalomicrobiaceae bacterium]